MADFAAHYIFGEMLRAEAAPLSGDDGLSVACFRWGLQGPDILFAHRFLTGGSHLPAAGNRMHDDDTARLFEAMAGEVIDRAGREALYARSYFYGFLCHYCLDAAVHPYVYSLVETRHAADPAREKDVHHFEIESAMDLDLYPWYYGLPVSHFRLAKLYRIGNAEKHAIARLYMPVLQNVYGVAAIEKELCAAIDSTLRLHLLEYAPAKAMVPVAGVLDALSGKRGKMRSFLKAAPPKWDSLNLAHVEWRSPFSGELRRESVPELMEQAKRRALHLLADYRELFRHRENRPLEFDTDFSGRVV